MQKERQGLQFRFERREANTLYRRSECETFDERSVNGSRVLPECNGLAGSGVQLIK